MSSFELFAIKYIATKGFIFGLLTICGLVLVVAACKSYLLWEKTEKKNYFVGGTMQGIMAFFCLMNGYPIFIDGVLTAESLYWVPSSLFSPLFFAIPSFLAWFFFSKTYDQWQKLKNLRSIKNLSLMWIWGLMALYSISVFFISSIRQAAIFLR